MTSAYPTTEAEATYVQAIWRAVSVLRSALGAVGIRTANHVIEPISLASTTTSVAKYAYSQHANGHVGSRYDCGDLVAGSSCASGSHSSHSSHSDYGGDGGSFGGGGASGDF